jgi:hypothetical protein
MNSITSFVYLWKRGSWALDGNTVGSHAPPLRGCSTDLTMHIFTRQTKCRRDERRQQATQRQANASSAAASQHTNYTRAMVACLEARGYSVK